MQGIEIITNVAILIMSVVAHELSHGYTARFLGDRTAEYEGRLTLNPISHVDLVGSVIVPALGYLFGGFIFGWAKPVPYNPYNLKDPRWGEFWIALAGPLTNIFIAVVFGLLLRASFMYDFASVAFQAVLTLIVIINISLAIFNLLPIPPLDGSKVLFNLLPRRFEDFRALLEQYGFIVVLIFAFSVWPVIVPVVYWFFSLITGVSLI